MKKAILFFVMILLLGCSSSDGDNPINENEMLMPLEIGNTWTYKIEDTDGISENYYTLKCSETTQYDSKTYYRLTYTFDKLYPFYDFGYLSNVSPNKILIGLVNVQTTPETPVSIHKVIPYFYKTDLSEEKFFEDDYYTYYSYNAKFKINNFSCYKNEKLSKNGSSKVIYYFAKNVGMIREENYVKVNGNFKNTSNAVLQNYSIK